MIRNKPFFILDRYIAGEFLFSFLVSFLFYFIIFFFNQITLVIQDVLAKGIPVGKVLRLLTYSIPSFVVLTAPFAILTGTLMTYGRLSSDNEILAMRSAGVPKRTIFRPVLVLGVVISLLSFGTNDILLPAGNRAFAKLWIELMLTYPGLELESYAARTLEDLVLITGKIDATGIHPMVIIERDSSGNRNVILAERATPNIRGRLEGYPGFRMINVFSLTPEAGKANEWSWTTASFMDYRLLAEETFLPQSQPIDMSSGDVRKEIRTMEAQYREREKELQEKAKMEEWQLASQYRVLMDGGGLFEEESDRKILERHLAEILTLEKGAGRDGILEIWRLEYYQKFAIPFAAIPFTLLGFTVGLMARRNGRVVGFGLSLIFTTIYWTFLIVGRFLGLEVGVQPALVMIVPNFVILALGGMLYLFESRA